MRTNTVVYSCSNSELEKKITQAEYEGWQVRQLTPVNWEKVGENTYAVEYIVVYESGRN